MIMILGALVENDNNFKSVFHFFKILIFWVVREVKGKNVVQNNKKITHYLRNHTLYDCDL